MRTDTPIPESVCVKCGYQMDAATEAYGESRPCEGDISMCLGCGHITVFDSNLSMRQPTAEEQERFLHDSRILQAQLARANIVGDKIKNRPPDETD